MAKSFFTTKDIKEFLSKNNLNWTGYIYNDDGYSKTYATEDDFDYSEHSSLVLEILNNNVRNSLVDMVISNFSFLIYTDASMFMRNGSFPTVDKDLSTKWQKFLLNKYHSQYAEMLFAWSIKNMSDIQTETEERIQEYSKSERAKAQLNIEKFNTSAKLAMTFLPSESLQNLDNENLI